MRYFVCILSLVAGLLFFGTKVFAQLNSYSLVINGCKTFTSVVITADTARRYNQALINFHIKRAQRLCIAGPVLTVGATLMAFAGGFVATRVQWLGSTMIGLSVPQFIAGVPIWICGGVQLHKWKKINNSLRLETGISTSGNAALVLKF